jgi:pathogenesis-related protein 1
MMLLIMALTGTLSVNPCAFSQDTLDMRVLAAHNAVRAEASLPPLRWSEELAAHARKWAATLVEKRWFFHNPDFRYGENLLITDMSITPEMVVSEWASESRFYSYETNTCGGVCGHYIQIVWRDTQKVGCAAAGDDSWEIWVCNYDPPGNYIGERPY